MLLYVVRGVVLLCMLSNEQINGTDLLIGGCRNSVLLIISSGVRFDRFSSGGRGRSGCYSGYTDQNDGVAPVPFRREQRCSLCYILHYGQFEIITSRMMHLKGIRF